MTPAEVEAKIADLIERLRARHNDTWPRQIGHGDLINEDGPAAADALSAQAAEIERMRGALEIIATDADAFESDHTPTAGFVAGIAFTARSALTGKDG